MSTFSSLLRLLLLPPPPFLLSIPQTPCRSLPPSSADPSFRPPALSFSPLPPLSPSVALLVAFCPFSPRLILFLVLPLFVLLIMSKTAFFLAEPSV